MTDEPRRQGPLPLSQIECPHCGEPTVANVLGDGRVVCSCPAHREVAAADPGTDANG